MIEIRGLAKTYAGHVALKNVNLSIRPGEFVVVLGPSGAGKSTLLRCINRLTAPSGGEIVVDGTPFSSSGRDEPKWALTLRPRLADPGDKRSSHPS